MAGSLPTALKRIGIDREKIMDLFERGLSSVEIYDALIEESKPYIKSHEQLLRCLSSIKGKVTLKRKKGETKQVKKFNVISHQSTVKQLSTNMIEKDFENPFITARKASR